MNPVNHAAVDRVFSWVGSPYSRSVTLAPNRRQGGEAGGIGGNQASQRENGLPERPLRSDLVRELFNLFPGIPFGVDVAALAGYPTDSSISHFMALMLFLVFASVVGYTLAVVAAGQARGYVVLRWIKDEYSIAAEDSLFFTDEPVNDPVDEN